MSSIKVLHYLSYSCIVLRASQYKFFILLMNYNSIHTRWNINTYESSWVLTDRRNELLCTSHISSLLYFLDIQDIGQLLGHRDRQSMDKARMFYRESKDSQRIQYRNYKNNFKTSGVSKFCIGTWYIIRNCYFTTHAILLHLYNRRNIYTDSTVIGIYL